MSNEDIDLSYKYCKDNQVLFEKEENLLSIKCTEDTKISAISYLQKYFDKCANKIGYEEASVTNLWFQQYNKNGKHGWHTHAENYTGVYYVKFSKDSAKTELINPFSQNKNKCFGIRLNALVYVFQRIANKMSIPKEKIRFSLQQI